MKIISITGGKGGIGKTTIAINLAISFARAGKRVLVFDADLGLANVDVLLGLKPEKTIDDFIKGHCSLNDVCMVGPHGIRIIPAASGIQHLAELKKEQSIELIHAFSSLSDKIDVMLIDISPGISQQVIDFTHAAQNILAVICNDPASLMDSYAVIKILHQKYGRQRFGIVVNKVRNIQEGYAVFIHFQETVAKFLNVAIEYVGHIPNDDYIPMAARENVAVCDRYPISPAAQAIRDIQQGVTHWAESSLISGGIQYFFEQLIQGKQGELCKV